MTVQALKLLGSRLRHRLFYGRLFQKKLVLHCAFAIAVGLLLYETYVSYSSLEEFTAEYADITASYEVLKKTEELISLMKEMEASERGYLITQDNSFLDAYYKSRELSPQQLLDLEQVANTNLEHRAHLDQIRKLLQEVHLTYDHLINLSRYKSPQEAIQSLREKKGKVLMDSLRKEIRRFEEKNRSLLWERKLQSDQAKAKIKTNSVFGNLISISLLCLTFVFLRKQLKKEEQQSRLLESEVQKRTEELHVANEELLAGNEELNSYLDNIHATQQELEQQQEKLQQAYAALEEENDRKSAELQEARELQLALLPHDPPAFPHLDLKLYLSSASEVGGDYYDYEIDEKGNITFAIGDVTGHGLKAGILVATAKSYFQNLCVQPGAVIMQAISRGIKNLKLRGMYMGLAIIKQSGKTFKITAAGMPPILVYRSASQSVEQVRLTGIFLGFHEKQQYKEEEVVLETGDILLSMTDGLIECFNDEKESLGIARMAEYLCQVAHLPSEDIVNALVKYGESWAKDTTIRDDVSIIAIKMK
ncbi:SpoIIE family protein phosphatase [Nafulsella turpanensis]|uniref:SpoIIE family protein phosphatase n=1 Tax=Nafulsella turpanensis TaxID=1265690 RepID=UPI000348F42C|nr:SpoIIE family protein phosphatase [Nafulsella turpanensis]